jgi:hypothetical protein
MQKKSVVAEYQDQRGNGPKAKLCPESNSMLNQAAETESGAAASQGTGWKHNDGPQKLQHSSNRNSHNAEGQKNQPDQGI